MFNFIYTLVLFLILSFLTYKSFKSDGKYFAFLNGAMIGASIFEGVHFIMLANPTTWDIAASFTTGMMFSLGLLSLIIYYYINFREKNKENSPH